VGVAGPGSGKRGAQACVVGGFFLGIEEADAGGRDFVEQLLRFFASLAGLKGPQVQHQAVSRVGDDLGVGFEERDAQKAVMICRLLMRRDAEPGVVGIKAFRHAGGPVGGASTL